MNSNVIVALRGPVVMMTLGTVLALDHFTDWRFSSTWPSLLIIYGVMKLLEHTFPAGPAGPFSGPGAGV
jgi:hypothetical protein